MAYRFLLEVPDSLAAEANVAVNGSGDAQIVVVRPHGRIYDEPYVDLTIAAHTLGVIDNLYRWFDNLGASRPDIRLVLHSGQRLQLEAYDRATIVSAIRRDQPWVERSIPKIGEHEVLDTSTALARLSAESDAAPAVATTPVTITPEEERPLRIRALNHVGVTVLDLPRAERFYAEFLSMDLIGRARIAPDGALQELNENYSWDQARATGTEADVTFMRNGPVVIGLYSVGRGARLDRSLLDRISVRLDATAFSELKGRVLIRSYEIITTSETSFVCRDPFGVVWEFTLAGATEAIS